MLLFEQVYKKYPVKHRSIALQDISFKIADGEFVFLVGSSGSGKSTLLKLIIREEKVTKGRIHVLGRDVFTLNNRRIAALRKNIGVIFQDFKLLQDKTIQQNLNFVLEIHNIKSSKRLPIIDDVLEIVGLNNKRNNYPDELSGGEQQRAAIARAFINRPRLLLADEPTGNLDPYNTSEIIKLLDLINQSGTTVIMSTHDSQIVNLMRKRVLILQNGRLISDEKSGSYEHYR